ncbi:10 kDa chaperonin [Cellulomonas carbonis]|uniref:10 kDa chaperonin n=2 Tax=Cellulomonas carbonis TaxID=1386092 RepID=A0A0A0BSD4_9CELL|nr:chaperonin [Cellulomonas carbonis T26]GGB98611.1 10 kDa chaperonin [Cellulomonas carbonis]
MTREDPRSAPAATRTPGTSGAPGSSARGTTARLPLRMLHDRVLVHVDAESSERLSTSGIVIPATAAVGRRLAWALVVAVGPNVRQVSAGDKVLFDPEDRAEVELQGTAYVLLRERDLHGVAEPEASGQGTGLYL